MKLSAVLLLAIVIIGGVLRLWQIGESFWVDELHTSWTVAGPLSVVAERAALGNQSPLYFWLAWFVVRLPIQPELALRLPSLLAGCALPVAIYWLAKKLLPAEEKSTVEVAPLLAAAIVAIDPLAIFYAQEARPYALLQLVVVVHFALLLRVLERSAWQLRAGWVVTGALIVHLHYTGALVLIAECVSLLILVALSARNANQEISCGDKSDNVAMCFSCWIDLGALALLLLPAIPGILAVAARRENWKQFVEPQPVLEILRIFLWTPAIVPLIALHRWRPVVSQRHLVLLAGWLLVPLCLAWVCTQADFAALFHKRYLIAAWPASILAAALCLRLSPNRLGQLSIGIIVLAVSLAEGKLVNNWLQDGRLLHDRNEDWRAAIAELNSQLTKSTPPHPAPVLVRSGLIEADELRQSDDPGLAEYCSYPVRGAYSLPPETPVYPLTTKNSGKTLLPAARAKLNRSTTQSFWLVGRGSAASREQTLNELRGSITEEEIWSPQSPQTFGNVYLQQVVIRER